MSDNLDLIDVIKKFLEVKLPEFNPWKIDKQRNCVVQLTGGWNPYTYKAQVLLLCDMPSNVAGEFLSCKIGDMEVHYRDKVVLELNIHEPDSLEKVVEFLRDD